MNYKTNLLKTRILVVLVSSFLIWVFFLSGIASAASITLSGPSSVTESTSGGTGSLDGVNISIGSQINLAIQADTSVSISTDDDLTLSLVATGDCGFGGGKGGDTTLLGRNGGKRLYMHTNQAPHESVIWVFPFYNPEYTGTRTCTISASHDAASSSNSEIVSVYGGKTIASYKLSILDTQSAPVLQPSSSTPTSAPISTSQNPTSSSTPSTEITKPSIPTAKLVDSDGKELTLAEGKEKISYNEKDPIVLSGTTVPNGVVKLYIFSEPQEATVTADDEGNWSYTIASIEPGDHRVEIEVTDPESGETSVRAEVLSFQVAQADATDDNIQGEQAPDLVAEESGAPVLLIAIGSIVTVLTLALLVVSKMHPIKYISHLIKH